MKRKLFLTLVVVALSASGSFAAGVVGTGTPVSCTEAALEAALAGGGLVTFDCGAAVFEITLTATKTIVDDTTIDGGSRIRLSGDRNVRILVVEVGATLTLENITLTKGAASGTGGAILNRGVLDVNNCVFTKNTVVTTYAPEDFGGGAIFNDEGTLSATDSTFSKNRVSGQSYWYATGGGAIANKGASGSTLSITNCLFSRNKADFTGGAVTSFNPAVFDGSAGVNVANSTFIGNRTLHGGGGGGIFSSGTLTVTGSTFSANKASNNGGAVDSGLLTGYDSNLVVVNSTFTKNKGCEGGAIHFQSLDNVSSITNSTFVKNKGCAGLGGAIANINGGETLPVVNSIFSYNIKGGNCAGDITDGGHNLRWPSTDPSCVGAFGDPQLEGLKDNGGPTRTMALKLGSAAIDAGDNAACAAPPVNNVDQRGFGRPGAGNANCSIGAYEYNAVP